MAEIHSLYVKRRITVAPRSVLAALHASENCFIHPLDEFVVSKLPIELNIHDGVIVATALIHAESEDFDSVQLITRDRAVKASGLVRTVW